MNIELNENNVIFKPNDIVKYYQPAYSSGGGFFNSMYYKEPYNETYFFEILELDTNVKVKTLLGPKEVDVLSFINLYKYSKLSSEKELKHYKAKNL